MRKFTLLLIVAYSFLSCHKDGNFVPLAEFYKTYGGSGFDNAQSLIEVERGAYVFAGLTSSNDGDVSGSHGGQDAWVVKVDKNGGILWQRTLGGSGGDVASSIIQVLDDQYVMAGYSYSHDGDGVGNHGGQDALVIKLRQNGSPLWNRSVGGSQQDAARAITPAPDGGCVVAGFTISNDGNVSGNHGSFDLWVFKLDRYGNLVWQRTLGGSDVDQAFSITNSSDGGYVVAGETSSNNGDVMANHGSADVWIVKLDSRGNKVWQKTFGGSGYDRAYSISPTTDGGYVVSGLTESQDGDVQNYMGSTWVLKLNRQGNLVWQKSYDMSAHLGNSIINSETSGYALASGQSSLLKLDHNGHLEWQKSATGTFRTLVSRCDGSFVLGGGVSTSIKSSDAVLTTMKN